MAKRASKSNGRAKPRRSVGDAKSSIPAGLYVQSLTLRNVRCFGDEAQTLTLLNEGETKPRWTLLVGSNGTGKSTVLQCIGSIYVWGEHHRVSDQSSTERFLGLDETLLDGSSVVAISARNVDVDASVSMNLVAQSNPPRTMLLSSHFSTAWPNEIGRELGYVESLGEDDAAPHVFGYGAWRRLGRSSLIQLEDASSTKHLFRDDVDLINAEEWLLRTDYAATKTKAGSRRTAAERRFNTVAEMLRLLLPDVESVRLAEPENAFPMPRALFGTPYGEVELRQLGYGYQSLIAWVVDFAARLYDIYSELENPLAGPAICLVDEIDLHLHPSWQRKVLRYLSERFPNTQFVATAHSPLIVQAAAEMGANIAVLKRVGDHVVISQNPIDVRGWRADQILGSELFDEQPLRSPDVQARMDERQRLLGKSRLTVAEKSRLAELNAFADLLPVESTSADRAISDRMRQATELLERMASTAKHE